MAPIDDDYQRFCEKYSQPVPGTEPHYHQDMAVNFRNFLVITISLLIVLCGWYLSTNAKSVITLWHQFQGQHSLIRQ